MKILSIYNTVFLDVLVSFNKETETCVLYSIVNFFLYLALQFRCYRYYTLVLSVVLVFTNSKERAFFQIQNHKNRGYQKLMPLNIIAVTRDFGKKKEIG